MRNRVHGWWLAAALAAVWPTAAQLVIDPSAVPAYPMPPKVEEEEKPKVKEPPSYAGERIEITAECEQEKLGSLGMICNTASPCEMRLELTGAREAGESVVAIGDVYSPSATVESLVLRTTDDGATWIEAAERIAGASFDELHFADAEHGWIVARDNVGGGHQPFLLASDDSGKSWTRWAIDEDEDFRGSVLQVRFDSPEHGFVIVERAGGLGDPFELRETFNGGRSWSLRQVTAERPALPGSRRRVPEPNVRTREDAGEGLYVVERRAGADWDVLGRFLGTAGVCDGTQ
jgi:hypothetical protein